MTGGSGRTATNVAQSSASIPGEPKVEPRDGSDDGLLHLPPPVPPVRSASQPVGHVSMSASAPASASVPASTIPTLSSAPVPSLPALAASGAIIPGVGFAASTKLLSPPSPPPVPTLPVQTQLQGQQKITGKDARTTGVLGLLPVLTVAPTTEPLQGNNQSRQEGAVVASFTAPPALPVQTTMAGKIDTGSAVMNNNAAIVDSMEVDTDGGTLARAGENKNAIGPGTYKFGRPSGRAAQKSTTAGGTGSTSNRNGSSNDNSKDHVVITDGGGGGRSGDSNRGIKVGAGHFASPELNALKQDVEKRIAVLKRALDRSEEELASKEEDYISKTWSHGNVMRGWDTRDSERDRAKDREFVKDKNKDRDYDKENAKNAADGGKEQYKERERSKMAAGSGSSTGAATSGNKHRRPRLTDRVFSLSSSTSAIRRQHPDILTTKRNAGGNRKKKKRS